MKPSKIADKIVVGLYKQFLETGQNFSSAEAVVERFPDEAPYLVHTAISMLNADGLLSVLYANNEPAEIALNVSAIQQCDSKTLLKRGYAFMKELRGWL